MHRNVNSSCPDTNIQKVLQWSPVSMLLLDGRLLFLYLLVSYQECQELYIWLMFNRHPAWHDVLSEALCSLSSVYLAMSMPCNQGRCPIMNDRMNREWFCE